MGRAKTPLTPDQAERALAYLQRALNRKADLFAAGIKETGRALSALRQRGLTLRRDDFVAEANAWVDRHVTSAGRQTMLAALRQERVESRRAGTVRSIRVTAATHEALSKLAAEKALSLSDAIASLVADAQLA